MTKNTKSKSKEVTVTCTANNVHTTQGKMVRGDIKTLLRTEVEGPLKGSVEAK